MITPRIEKIRQNYVNAKPQISCQRAAIWTESFQTTEGQPACIRAARAFYDCCDRLGVHIFEGELVVGAVGEFRKCGILTPEFSWMWVDREMDQFATRPQDPYVMTEEQRQFVRETIFPYWKGKSLEEAFLARLPAETRRIAVDTGVIDSDSKWRQAVGEITPDYQDVLFKKGFAGIWQEAETKIAALDDACAEDEEKRNFTNRSSRPVGGSSGWRSAMRMRPTAWPKPNRTPPGPPSCASSPKTAASCPPTRPKLSGRRLSSSGSPSWAASCPKTRWPSTPAGSTSTWTPITRRTWPPAALRPTLPRSSSRRCG